MVFTEMQIGKNGISDNFIQTLKGSFQTHDNVRISVLPSAGRSKEQIQKYTQDILEKLGDNYTAKLIGFKITLKKWRHSMKK